MPPGVLHVFDHSAPVQSAYSLRSRSMIEAQQAAGWRTVQITSSRQAVYAQGSSPLSIETADGFVFHRTFPGPLARVPVLRFGDRVRSLASRIERVCESESIDLIHAHSPSLNGVAAMRVAQARRVPLVYEVRAFWEDAAVDRGTMAAGGVRYRASRALETYVLRHADQIVCVGEGLRRNILSRGVAPSRVSVIPNGVDSHLHACIGRDVALESAYGLKGSPILAFIGSLHRSEGVDLLLDALPSISGHVPDVKVLLIGTGPEEAALRGQARRLCLSERVVFVPNSARSLTARFASLADVFVFPRRSSPLTELVPAHELLEAMARRRLVLASDVGGNREIIEPAGSGLLFRHDDAADLASKAAMALSRPEAFRGMIDRAFAFVSRNCDWHRLVEEYARVYENALHDSALARIHAS